MNQICESMLILREARKAYVRAPGTKSLVNGDNLALILAELDSEQVLMLCEQLLTYERWPYPHLNRGQRSMNMRNRLRGAVRRGEITLEQIAAVRDAMVAAQQAVAPRTH